MDMLETARSVTISPGQALAEFGAQANAAAQLAAFELYQDRRPINTQRSQRAALKIFADFMRSASIAVPDLYSDPLAWQGITWGLVQGFQKWLLQQGYSMKTINDRVSIVKVYMSLANQAGVIPDSEILRVQGLRGFSRKEAIDMDHKRAGLQLATRVGNKKAAAVTITEEQARALCQVRSNTPQGRRDALMMCLLLDHGLRVGEIASLAIESVNIETRQLTFYRQKTGKISRHALRGRAWYCMVGYLAMDQHAQSGSLLMASVKSGALVPGSSLTVRAINQRVNQLGQAMGLENLSPHDCRHHGATKAGNDPKVSLASLMQWGGWDSPTSAARYIDHGGADNDGVSLGMD
jgi:site-specific recombinase XerC